MTALELHDSETGQKVALLAVKTDALLHQQAEAKRQEEGKRRLHVARMVEMPDLTAQAEGAEMRARIAKANTEEARALREQEILKNPPYARREITPEEAQRQRLKKAEAEVERLIANRDKRLSEYLRGRQFEELSPYDQDEYRAEENAYNHRIREAKKLRMEHE